MSHENHDSINFNAQKNSWKIKKLWYQGLFFLIINLPFNSIHEFLNLRFCFDRPTVCWYIIWKILTNIATEAWKFNNRYGHNVSVYVTHFLDLNDLEDILHIHITGQPKLLLKIWYTYIICTPVKACKIPFVEWNLFLQHLFCMLSEMK